VYSPYSCFNEIQLDGSGSATAVYGFQGQDSPSVIKQKKSFIINADNDLNEIEEKVDRIISAPKIDTGRAYDLYRFTVFVNGKRVFDGYNQDSLITGILKLLLPYVEDKNNGECDFFNLLEQSIRSHSPK
jgi:hypothetical protein